MVAVEEVTVCVVFVYVEVVVVDVVELEPELVVLEVLPELLKPSKNCGI